MRIVQGILVSALVLAVASGLVGCSGLELTGSTQEEPATEPTHAIVVITQGDWNYFVSAALDGSESTTLTGRFAGLSRPVISPDGSKILYVLDPSVNSTIPEPSLHVFDIASREDTTLATGDAISTTSWTPDGDPVAWLSKPRPLMAEPGPDRGRRLVRFGAGGEEVLISLEDTDSPLGIHEAPRRVIGGDEEGLYLLEGEHEWRGTPPAMYVLGIWRMPLDGSAPQLVADLTGSADDSVTIDGERYEIQPGLEDFLDPQVPLSGDDGVPIAFRPVSRYRCLGIASHDTTLTYSVCTYRLSDGEIIEEAVRTQVLRSGLATGPPSPYYVAATVADPYTLGRIAEEHRLYAGVIESEIIEIVGDAEVPLALETAAGLSPQWASPLRYLTDGDLLFSAWTSGESALCRYDRDSGESATLCVLGDGTYKSWDIMMLGLQ